MKHRYRISKRMAMSAPCGESRYPDVRTCWQWCQADAGRLRSAGIDAVARLDFGFCWVERLDWEPCQTSSYDKQVESMSKWWRSQK